MQDDAGDAIAEAATPMPDGRLVLRADRLFGTRQEVEIHVGAIVYRLRLTKAGKLILTK
ncbi:hemin uptake protein HemP [Jiella endophytica]|nr:hemin uptake protein HemP [Jiella endophytica]